MDWSEHLSWAGAAAAVGLLVGIERGWQLRDAPEGTRVAGVRTFTLLGFLAGFAGFAANKGFELVAAVVVAGAAATLSIGYARRSNVDTKADATTAVAGFLTLALGFTAGIGSPSLAIAGASIATFVLALRPEARSLVGRLTDADVKAFARYSVIAAAAWPFLPNGTYGPYDAWNPQKLWLVVILVTGFSFAGYVANRLFGSRHGTMATAIIGGAYSSTAVTYSLAQRLGAREGGGAENAGIAAATAVMYLRVILLVAALATSVLIPFLSLMLPALLTGAAASLWLYFRAPDRGDAVTAKNPIALFPALTFALFVAAAAVVARWAEGRFGEQGVALLILIMGSMDVDTAVVTVGGLKAGAISPDLAALALAGTVLANMMVKFGVTIVYAGKAARSAVAALGASMIALAGSLAIGFLSQ